MNQRLLLVTDLDGTLLGDEAALEQFCRWLHLHRSAITLVYATGRTTVDVRRLVRADQLPAPDHIVGSVGAEIVAFGHSQTFDQWEARVQGHWNRMAICDALSDVPDLVPQPDEFQSEFKVSYFLECAEPKQIHGIAARLAARQLTADVIYSGNRFVDVLPRGMNKGTAVEFIAQRLRFHQKEVIACGDSGNDLSMCERGFRAVLVANADEDLTRHARHPRYQSRLAYAAGVLDGIQYWTSRAERTSTSLSRLMAQGREAH